MSYNGLRGLGSYYAMNGFGACCGGGVGAFGAIDFDAAQVWSNWTAGASGNNAAGKTAAQNVQAALNQLGYGPITVDGQFGAGSLAAWKKFANANGVEATWPDQAGILKLGEMVKSGGNPGGGTQVESHVVGGQFVPGPAAGQAAISSKAAMSTGTMLGIGAIVLVGIGALAIVAKKKKSGAPASSHATV